VLARSLDAELSTVAWSGKGVYNNYNGNRVEPMPKLYDRAVPNDKNSPWDFSWQPDLIIINLGTNDYSTNNDPTDTQLPPQPGDRCRHGRRVGHGDQERSRLVETHRRFGRGGVGVCRATIGSSSVPRLGSLD
jgi:hypothetical protein